MTRSSRSRGTSRSRPGSGDLEPASMPTPSEPRRTPLQVPATTMRTLGSRPTRTRCASNTDNGHASYPTSTARSRIRTGTMSRQPSGTTALDPEAGTAVMNGQRSPPGTTDPVRIGRSLRGSGWDEWHLDEVRLSNTARSACWIAAEYNNEVWPNKAVTPTPNPSPNPSGGFYGIGAAVATAVELVSLQRGGAGRGGGRSSGRRALRSTTWASTCTARCRRRVLSSGSRRP